MMKKIIKMLHADFLVFGIVSFLFLAANHYYPEKFTVKYLWLFLAILFSLSFFGILIFKEGAGQKSLWARRGVMMGLSCFITVLAIYLFNMITTQQLLVYAVKFLILDVMLSTAAYIIADKNEKKTLQKINEKLKQLNKE